MAAPRCFIAAPRRIMQGLERLGELPVMWVNHQPEAEPMAPRANWRGTLRVAELACPVALYTAASTSQRLAFHLINRATGNRVRREFVDADTGRTVPPEDQVKGYEVADGDHVLIDPEDIAAAIPESDKVLAVEAFIACNEVDDVYFDKPYYLAPGDRPGQETFVLIRDGMAAGGVVAIARTVLFRRMRTVLIRAHRSGLIATTLNFDYEVRPAKAAFQDIPARRIDGEMLDLARHIIHTKMGKFDPSAFDDRYEAALQDLVRARIEGRSTARRPLRKHEKVVNLMEVLRASAEMAGKQAAPRKRGGGRASAGKAGKAG